MFLPSSLKEHYAMECSGTSSSSENPESGEMRFTAEESAEGKASKNIVHSWDI
jgi:hypothetical protein